MEEGGGKKRLIRREEELLETALAAAAAALLVSGLKKLLPSVLKQWPPMATVLMSPPPLLFLVLNLIIASIVVISFHPKCEKRNRPSHDHGRKDGACRKAAKRQTSLGSNADDHQEEKPRVMDKQLVRVEEEEEEDIGDAEELNARVEAFIAAFRRQLRVDSFSAAGIHRTKFGSLSS